MRCSWCERDDVPHLVNVDFSEIMRGAQTQACTPCALQITDAIIGRRGPEALPVPPSRQAEREAAR